MKAVILSFVFTALLSGSAFAEEPKASTKESAMSAETSKEKKSRKKKAMMCADCGKPESECDCKGHKGEEHKNEQKQ